MGSKVTNNGTHAVTQSGTCEKRIRALEARNSALQNRISALEASQAYGGLVANARPRKSEAQGKRCMKYHVGADMGFLCSDDNGHTWKE